VRAGFGHLPPDQSGGPATGSHQTRAALAWADQGCDLLRQCAAALALRIFPPRGPRGSSKIRGSTSRNTSRQIGTQRGLEMRDFSGVQCHALLIAPSVGGCSGLGRGRLSDRRLWTDPEPGGLHSAAFFPAGPSAADQSASPTFDSFSTVGIRRAQEPHVHCPCVDPRKRQRLDAARTSASWPARIGPDISQANWHARRRIFDPDQQAPLRPCRGGRQLGIKSRDQACRASRSAQDAINAGSTSPAWWASVSRSHATAGCRAQDRPTGPHPRLTAMPSGAPSSIPLLSHARQRPHRARRANMGRRLRSDQRPTHRRHSAERGLI